MLVGAGRGLLLLPLAAALLFCLLLAPAARGKLIKWVRWGSPRLCEFVCCDDVYGIMDR